MADWIGLAAEWLEPIYRLMYRELLAGDYLQADETPVRCNDPDEKRGGTSQGWLWVISRPGGDVVFDWRRSRRHGELTSLLKDYRGILQSDGHAAYPSFARSRAGVVWVGCWAHARRYFFAALGERPKAVQLVLRLIGRLYQLEHAWDAANVGEHRAALRQAHLARPLYWLRRVVLGLRSQGAATLVARHGVFLPARSLGAAQRAPRAQPDPARQQSGRKRHPPLRDRQEKLALHRSSDAGQRSAIVYSLVVSCQRHGIDPLAYLRDVLTRLPAMTNRDDLGRLMPARWRPAP